MCRFLKGYFLVQVGFTFKHHSIKKLMREMVFWKVIWENKEGVEDSLPSLVYISREKRPKHPHHYKAGAMNVLVIFIFIFYSH